MSEYNFVEKPFLEQLAKLGWTVIDQGPGIPQDPKVSKRDHFKEFALKEIFKESVRKINVTPDKKEWLTDDQLNKLFEEVTHHPAKGLVEANQAVLKLLFKAHVDRNDLTGEEWPAVKLIDFENKIPNHFLAINQFRIDTPGRVKEMIIPDLVLFVNGLPIVVVECKDANAFTSNPMYEAFKQLMRYSDQRPDTHESELHEGDPRLFFSNQFLIRTTGDRADVGSITATDEEFWFAWKYIPDEFTNYEPPLGREREQEVLIQGLLAKSTLLDVIRTCIVFMDTGQARVKVVPRYQQYRAVCKIVHRLLTGETPRNRSGVIWHTQGSGKSLTMVFAIRKLRLTKGLNDFKIVIVNDRTDLEEQLGGTIQLTDEPVTVIESTDDLKKKLEMRSSNLNMVMVHKFLERADNYTPAYLWDIIGRPGAHDGSAEVAEPTEPLRTYQAFGVVNSSDKVLIVIDEAHRTMSGDLGGNLFEAFPNATYLAFTGTPLITDRHSKTTCERFGTYVDKYKLYDAVKDGATVEILYEGKTAETEITDKNAFDVKFADLFKRRTEAEILAIKKRYGTKGDIFEADARIREIADDLVNHYIDNILPNGFKAQVVCHSKSAAEKYEKFVNQAVQVRLKFEQSKPAWEGDLQDLSDEDRIKYRDEELIEKIEFLQSAVVVSSEGTNELARITMARKRAKERDAVNNFKRAFDYVDPERKNTGIAFLIVCDMLLTGFDAPIEQVMYLDQKIKEHTLLQTIARVNRIHKGKSRGYIIDYIGLANNLKEALSIYAGEDYDDVKDSLKDLSAEIPILESRYQRLLNLFLNKGIKQIEEFVEQRIKDARENYQILDKCIDLLGDIRVRADFEVYLKNFMQSMDIILPNAAANRFKIPAKRFGYLLAQVKQRYKDNSLNLDGAGEKVKKLINEYLVSKGIDPKIPPIEITSPDFLSHLEKDGNPKAKASEMEHAIRKHCKVHFGEDPAFYGKLSAKVDALLEQLRDDWQQLSIQLASLVAEAKAGRKGNDVDGLSALEGAFYDLIANIAFNQNAIPDESRASLIVLVQRIVLKLRSTITIVAFWRRGSEVDMLKGDLADIMLLSGITEVELNSSKLVIEVTDLAKVRHEDILK